MVLDPDAEALELIKRTAQTDLDRARRYGRSDANVRFRFALPQLEGARFQEIAERERLDARVERTLTAAAAEPFGRVSRVVAGEAMVVLMVTGNGRAGAVAAAATRFSRAFRRGVVIEVEDVSDEVDEKRDERDPQPDAQLTLSAPPSLQPGTISISAQTEADVDITLPERGGSGDVAKALRKAIASRRPMLPPDDSPDG